MGIQTGGADRPEKNYELCFEETGETYASP